MKLSYAYISYSLYIGLYRLYKSILKINISYKNSISTYTNYGLITPSEKTI